MAAEATVSEWVLPSRHSGAASNEAAKTKAEMAKEAGVGTTTFKHATPRFLNWFHPATLYARFCSNDPLISGNRHPPPSFSNRQTGGVYIIESSRNRVGEFGSY